MKFSSATLKLQLTPEIETQQSAEAAVGDVILVEVQTVNEKYPFLEQPNGELTPLKTGDKVIGVIGGRQALRGFVGYPAKYLNTQLSLLNMGGIIGCYVDAAVGLGEPTTVKYLGSVVDTKGIINVNRNALPEAEFIQQPRQIIFILGTCMNVGKTTSITGLIAAATKAGYKVGAAKLAGIAAIKDLESFKKAGAVDVKSFLDCGLPSTIGMEDLAPTVKKIINALQGDLLIIELGDGIMGHYKVETVLMNPSIMEHVHSIVVCAADITAAYGAKHYLQNFGVKVDVFSGPATDNIAGSQYIEEKFSIPAINGMKFPEKLFSAAIGTTNIKE